MKTPFALYPLLLLHFLLGASALYGGWVLMTDPGIFGADPAWLEGTPFGSYFIPGLFLFLLMGVFPLLVCWGLLRRPAGTRAGVFNIYPERHWAWTYSLFTGLIVIIWITVQLTMLPGSWLQPFYISIGLLILVLTLLPAVMKYYLVQHEGTA